MNYQYLVEIGCSTIGKRLYGPFENSEQARIWGEANANRIWQEIARRIRPNKANIRYYLNRTTFNIRSLRQP